MSQRIIYSEEFKHKLVAEVVKGVRTCMQISKKYNVAYMTLKAWRNAISPSGRHQKRYTESDWEPIDKLFFKSSNRALAKIFPMTQNTIRARRKHVNGLNLAKRNIFKANTASQNCCAPLQKDLVITWTRSPELQAHITRWNHAPHL